MNVSFIQTAIDVISHFDAEDPAPIEDIGPPSTAQLLIQHLYQFDVGEIAPEKFNEEFRQKFSQLKVSDQERLIGQLAHLNLVSAGPKERQVQQVFQELSQGVTAKEKGETKPAEDIILGHDTDFTDPQAIPSVKKEIDRVCVFAEGLKAKGKFLTSDLMQKDVMDSVFDQKLYLGSSNASRSTNFENLKSSGVDHVLIILEPSLAGRFRRTESINKAGFTVSVLPVADLAEGAESPEAVQIFKDSLTKAFAFLDEGLKSGSGTVIHCNKGIHRSPAVLMAYFMYKYGVSFEEAETYLKTKRTRVDLAEGSSHAFREYLKSPDYQAFMEELSAGQ